MAQKGPGTRGKSRNSTSITGSETAIIFPTIRLAEATGSAGPLRTAWSNAVVVTHTDAPM